MDHDLTLRLTSSLRNGLTDGLGGVCLHLSGSFGPNFRKTHAASHLTPNLSPPAMALRQYWSMKFPDDPIERTYVGCFSEPKALHLHFHLIPRTRKFGQGNPTEHAAWRIIDLTETWASFPEPYR